MLYIPTNVKIDLEWSVKKGAGNEAEDFSRSTVSLFLFSDKNRWAVRCRADYTGVVRAELPELLPEGVYSLELIWVKNDKYLGMRCLQRTRKVCVFAVSDGVALPQGATQGEPVLLKMSTVAAPFGYDGLSAYELCVLRGKTLLSEEEWCARLCQGDQGTDTPDIPDTPTPPSTSITGSLSGGGNYGYGRPVTINWSASEVPTKVEVRGSDGSVEIVNNPSTASGSLTFAPTQQRTTYALYLNGSSSAASSTTVELYFPVYIGAVSENFNAYSPDLSQLAGWALDTFGPCSGTQTLNTDGSLQKVCVAVPNNLQIAVSIYGANYLSDMIKVNDFAYKDLVSGLTAKYTVYTNASAANCKGVALDYKVTE